MKTFVLGLAAASLFTLSTLGATPSVEILTSFTADPAQQGWKTFGNSNLFKWNSTNGCLDVTWDSSKSNSYFYYPIGTVLTRKDDFTMEFDLTINDISTSFDQMALGFLNLGDATSSEFSPIMAVMCTLSFQQQIFGNEAYPWRSIGGLLRSYCLRANRFMWFKVIQAQHRPLSPRFPPTATRSIPDHLPSVRVLQIFVAMRLPLRATTIRLPTMEQYYLPTVQSAM
jgi:hypothetical protein